MLCSVLVGRRPLTTHEVYVAQTAREMLERGEWMLPTCFNEPRLKKPPLAYWQTMAAFSLLGRSELAARAPSVLAALALTLFVHRFARRSFGPKIAFLAAFFQASSVAALTQSRLAEADMTLALWVAAALISFAGLLDDEIPGLRRAGSKSATFAVWAFWASAALGILAKGPVALLFVFGTIAACSAVSQTLSPIRRLIRPVPILAAVSLAGFWPAMVCQRCPEAIDVWFGETISRFAADPNGVQRIPGYYVWAALWLTLPWTGFWLYELLHAAPKRGIGRPAGWSQGIANRRVALRRFLLCWFLAPMLLLSFSGGKQEHYLIPALTPLSVFAALGACRLQHALRRRWMNRTIHRSAKLRWLVFSWGAAGTRMIAPAALVVGVNLLLAGRHDGRREAADWISRKRVAMPADLTVALVGHSMQYLAFYCPGPVRYFDSPEAFQSTRDNGEAAPTLVVAAAEVASRFEGFREIDRAAIRRLPERRRPAMLAETGGRFKAADASTVGRSVLRRPAASLH